MKCKCRNPVYIYWHDENHDDIREMCIYCYEKMYHRKKLPFITEYGRRLIEEELKESRLCREY